jgi:hypothetical protein
MCIRHHWHTHGQHSMRNIELGNRRNSLFTGRFARANLNFLAQRRALLDSVPPFFLRFSYSIAASPIDAKTFLMALLLIASQTGMPQEIVALRIKGKRSAFQDIPVTGSLSAALLKWKDIQQRPLRTAHSLRLQGSCIIARWIRGWLSRS